MASLMHRSSLLVALLLLMVLLSPSSASIRPMITDVMTKQICSQTRDPNLCNHILRDDPRTHTADLYGLASTAVNLGLTNLTDTANYIKSLLSNGGINRQELTDCLNNYDTAIYSLNVYAKDLSARFYKSLDQRARNAADFITGCDGKFNGVSNPLAQRNHNALVLIDTAASVAILLKKEP